MIIELTSTLREGEVRKVLVNFATVLFAREVVKGKDKFTTVHFTPRTEYEESKPLFVNESISVIMRKLKGAR